MKLNSNDYLVQLPYVKDWLAARPDSKPIDEIGPLALATNTHIIVVTKFVIQICGSSPELESYKQRMMKFYNVEEVL